MCIGGTEKEEAHKKNLSLESKGDYAIWIKCEKMWKSIERKRGSEEYLLHWVKEEGKRDTKMLTGRMMEIERDRGTSNDHQYAVKFAN